MDCKPTERDILEQWIRFLLRNRRKEPRERLSHIAIIIPDYKKERNDVPKD